MSMTIGLWILPLIVTVVAFRWAFGDEFTRGDYNFGIVFSLPVAAFFAAVSWALYFAAMWWLA
jgi:uncharacterized YccA/Bax inhibitor family protein